MMTLDWCDNVSIQADDGCKGKYKVHELGPQHMGDAHEGQKLEEFIANKENCRAKRCCEEEVSGKHKDADGYEVRKDS
jgi:hypothetical protein